MAELMVYLQPIYDHTNPFTDSSLVGWKSSVVMLAHTSWDSDLLWHAEGALVSSQRVRWLS